MTSHRPQIDPMPFLAGGGEAARMIREKDWSGHPLGSPETWPEALRTSLSLVLNSPESMILSWGPELSFFFNDTYFPLLGPRLPWAMGERFDKVWADGWEQARPIIEQAFEGRSRRFADLPWKLGTDRGSQDTWWTFSYSRVLDGDGQVAGLFIFTNETTARVLGDAALAESQRQLEAALSEVRDLNSSLIRQVDERTNERNRLWTLTEDMLARADYQGSMSAVNPAWTAVLGWTEHELLTNPYADIIHPEDVGVTVAALQSMGETKQPTRFENRILTASGEWKPIGWTVSPEADGVNFIAVGRDLADYRAREKELLQAQEALRQSQKMEAVGQLTGGLAHDFNNLLAGISGSLELLQTRLAQGRVEEIERYAAAAQGAARRAAALTHRLLAFSRRQTLDPKPTDVNRLVAGMEELIRRTVGPAITVEAVGGDGAWPILVDPNQLENALLNLAINARDAMPDGGWLTIETSNRWLDENAARERDLPPGQYLALCVSDDGTGMTPEVIERAFDPFFTTKPIGMGTGLGLSMIYGFARQSGGQVRISSQPGKGTTVCITLPRHHGDLDTAETAPDAAEAPRAATGQTVLVVDDEPIVRMLVVDILEELGYTALEAGDGAAGLKILQSDARIDLLVSDVGLPGGMNGRQMADAARMLRPELKILFITGYAEKAVLSHGHLDPGMHVMTKPFVMEALAGRIRELIAGP